MVVRKEIPRKNCAFVAALVLGLGLVSLAVPASQATQGLSCVELQTTLPSEESSPGACAGYSVTDDTLCYLSAQAGLNLGC